MDEPAPAFDPTLTVGELVEYGGTDQTFEAPESRRVEHRTTGTSGRSP